MYHFELCTSVLDLYEMSIIIAKNYFDLDKVDNSREIVANVTLNVTLETLNIYFTEIVGIVDHTLTANTLHHSHSAPRPRPNPCPARRTVRMPVLKCAIRCRSTLGQY
jgi:hypothetical protein